MRPFLQVSKNHYHQVMLAIDRAQPRAIAYFPLVYEPVLRTLYLSCWGWNKGGKHSNV